MLAETAPSCNDCVATIVARPFTTTVKGRNQPSGEEKSVLFHLIQESGGVSGLRESVDPSSSEMMIFIYYKKNNSNITNSSSPVFRSDLVAWGY